MLLMWRRQCIMVKFRLIIVILMLSLRTFSEAQTVSLQLCSPPVKGNACKMSCTTADHTDDIVFTRNGNERGRCSIVLGNPSCGANTDQPSTTVTTFDIASLSRTTDDGSWTCTYGSGPGVTDTQTLTVLTYPSTPSSADITHSTGMTTALVATSSQIVNLAVVMDCTSPKPTVTWNFKQCGTSTVVESIVGDVAEDTTASTVCGSSEKNYQSTASVSSSDGVAGKCVETQVDILVNGFTAHTVTADFTITFPEQEQSGDTTCIIIICVVVIYVLGIGAVLIVLAVVMMLCQPCPCYKEYTGIGCRAKCVIIGTSLGMGIIVAVVILIVLGKEKRLPCQKGSQHKKPDSGNSGSRSVTPNQVSPSIITTTPRTESGNATNQGNETKDPLPKTDDKPRHQELQPLTNATNVSVEDGKIDLNTKHKLPDIPSKKSS